MWAISYCCLFRCQWFCPGISPAIWGASAALAPLPWPEVAMTKARWILLRIRSPDRRSTVRCTLALLGAPRYLPNPQIRWFRFHEIMIFFFCKNPSFYQAWIILGSILEAFGSPKGHFGGSKNDQKKCRLFHWFVLSIWEPSWRPKWSWKLSKQKRKAAMFVFEYPKHLKDQKHLEDIDTLDDH